MIIQLLNGTSFDIADYNLRRLYHRIPSAEIEHSSFTVEGRSDIVASTKINNRVITVEFLYEAYNIYGFYLLRDRLNALFVRREPFYILFKNEAYKRFKVRLANAFEIEPHKSMSSFTISFITDIPFAESIGTTTDLKRWDVNKWGWNDSIKWNEELQYVFNNNNFTVRNLGNVAIDPREHELEVILKGTFASYVKITNQTTGDVYQYNAALSSTDELRLEGIRTFKNDASDFKNTNKKLLTLAVGDSLITVEGGTLIGIAFNFRFLYL